jgi:uncharacterized protein YjbI with pentapeptide repeats
MKVSSNTEYTNKNFLSLEVLQQNISYTEFTECIFTKCNFSETKFKECVFDNVYLKNAISNATLPNTN